MTKRGQGDLLRHRLSGRGRELAGSHPFPEYLLEHFEREAEPYDAESKRTGYIALCIAENKLVWDLLQPKVQAYRQVPHRALCYDAMIGSESFRHDLARFMGRTFLGREVSPHHLVVLAGAGSVLEMLFYAIADPGDQVLVPTPSYPGFWMDLRTRDGLEIVPVHASSRDGFQLTPELLDAALEGASRERVKALLFTTPSNPLGTVFCPEEVEEVLLWAERQGIHVVVDEIYALSVFGPRPFTSAAALRSSLGERIHIVWAFSKDFGMSGLRAGVLVSENQGLIRALDGLAYWACSSGDTQYVLGEMISDETWVDGYIREMQGRLGDAYSRVTTELRKESIPHLQAGAGHFVLCDLRRFLEESTPEGEERLWRRLLDEGNVNLTPGSDCRVREPGFMRLCYAAQPTDVAVEGVRRLGRLLHRSRGQTS